jgi:diguanylate cyclase (GGDEF)-like protein
MTLRRFSLITAAVCLLLVAVVSLVVSGVLDRSTSVAVDKFAQLTGATAAMVCYWRAGLRRHGTARRWRLWMAAAMASLVVGLCAWIWGQVFLGVSLPSTTVAPLGFILVPVLTLFAVLVLGHGGLGNGGSGSLPNHRGKVVIVLDGLIVVGLLFVAIAGLAQSSSGWVFAFLVSKGATAIPTASDIGFMICPAMFFLSSIAPSSPRRERSGTGRLRAGEMLHILVPYLPMLVTGLFIVVGTATGVRLNPFEIYVGLGVVLLVIARQLFTLIDNVKLLEQLRDSRERLRHQAYHDPLTGVANRVLFRERLNAALDRPDPLVVLFIDVDGFKDVNDNYGHAEGDAVLRIVAERLQHCVRPQDTVARLGGDEFGILVDGYPARPEEIGDRVLAAMASPHRTTSGEHVIRASIGISHRDAHDPALTADDLLGSADAAMYTAKRLGKGMVVVHGSVEAELS